MDSMDNFRERFEALEQRTEHLQQHTRMVARRLWWRITWRVTTVVAFGLALMATRPGQAADFACAAGDVACLIDAINTANANGEVNTIALEAGNYTLTAVDNDINGLPVITSTLTIRGEGAETTIIERDPSAPSFRILAVAATGTLTLKRLTLRGGGATFTSQFVGLGGGINNGGTLTLINCILTGNKSAFALNAGSGG